MLVEESREDGLVRLEECAEVKRRDFLGTLPVDGDICRDLGLIEEAGFFERVSKLCEVRLLVVLLVPKRLEERRLPEALVRLPLWTEEDKKLEEVLTRDASAVEDVLLSLLPFTCRRDDV